MSYNVILNKNGKICLRWIFATFYILILADIDCHEQSLLKNCATEFYLLVAIHMKKNTYLLNISYNTNREAIEGENIFLFKMKTFYNMLTFRSLVVVYSSQFLEAE